MITVSYLSGVYTLSHAVWAGPDSQIVGFLQALTNPEVISGADPDPDMAMIRAMKLDMEILAQDEPEYDPEAIY